VDERVGFAEYQERGEKDSRPQITQMTQIKHLALSRRGAEKKWDDSLGEG
jgi:hypothetical protein